ncbi:siderophore-interacting protein [Cryptosporangium aurantiacum]|uniref:Siderophore-interacting protein n=1 Tax=Cryptosporangium aurantiacum TaxID=134849 RepID=A0A1M7RPY3_9ACTN|nr:siderophore-interacting protein [Cryptosporangium aurantiacum]SHN48240.1 Siderophore-interacting protein [Cryptosporangium aurantiacum]
MSAADVLGRVAVGSGLLTAAQVVDNVLVSDAMHEVTLTAPEFGRWTTTPGQNVRLALGRLSFDVLRTYSIWTHTPERSELVLRGLDGTGRPDGPGGTWMASAEPGSTVLLTGPRGVFRVDPAAPWHLFAGDESGAVPLLAMRAALSPADVVHGMLEAAGRAGRIPALGADLPWIDRDDRGLADAVRDLQLPDEPGVAYLAGEQQACLAIRRYLREERGWPRRSVRVSAHWTPGKRGME